MRDRLTEAVLTEIERSHRSGMALVLDEAARRIITELGGSGPGIAALVERRLIREASHKCIPVLLGSGPEAEEPPSAID